MCGIAALLLQPQERTEREWESIREIFSYNLVFNEERGGEATGCAVIQNNGKAFIQKMPLPASEFVTQHEYLALIRKIDANTTIVLGHTRQSTKGNPDLSPNNHPLKAGTVIGVHNGHINNDDKLFARYHYPRKAQVDSEIIFRMLERVPPETSGEQYLGAIQPYLQLLEGQFTFLACDLRCPERLLVLKHVNPLYYLYKPEWNALVFSSRYIFLRKAFGNRLPPETVPYDRLLLFDAAILSKTGNLPAVSLQLYEDQK